MLLKNFSQVYDDDGLHPANWQALGDLWSNIKLI